MRNRREQIYRYIEPSTAGGDFNAYDGMMVVVIVASLLPLAFKETNDAFRIIETAATVIFIVDYILRWATADIKLEKGLMSFFVYPFTPMAILDLLSILPGVTMLNNGFRLLRMVRLLRIFRIFRVVRYSQSISMLLKVFSKEKDTLIALVYIAIGYIIVSALVIFNVEPATFHSFFDALYWATVSLTTVGYGDIYAVTLLGKIITMISSLFGIAIVAMPAGVITSGIIQVVNEKNVESKNWQKM